jgi:hypothetical protein
VQAAPITTGSSTIHSPPIASAGERLASVQTGFIPSVRDKFLAAASLPVATSAA